VDQEPKGIEIDEVLYLRRVVGRLQQQNEAFTESSDKLGALVDQLMAENEHLKKDVERLSNTVAAQGKPTSKHLDDN
jgi:phage host-nuclease inhibitor protein Gam